MNTGLSRNRAKAAISRTILVASVAIIVVVAGIIGYVATSPPEALSSMENQPQSFTIIGAGATFPYPLLSAMTVEYNNIRPGVKFNYQSIGSGGGIRQHVEKTIDFGASDAPLTEKQREAAPNTVHIPITIGAVVLAYNLPEIPKGLKITGPIIADIYLGKINKWSDPQIKKLNPELQLPDRDILVVHRSDGSGTTFIWTGYLSMVSPEWKEKVGQGTAVQWPLGLGAAGNEGVAGLILGTEDTVGYVELAYALQNDMTYAFIQNREGGFIEPTLETTSAAAAAAASTLPRGDQSWTNVNLLNAAGADSYPIASFSYLLVYKELSVLPSMNRAKAQELVDLLWWAVHEGQEYAPKLQYVPLPQAVVSLNEETIKSITFNGEPLRS